MTPKDPADLPVYTVLAAAGSGTRLGFDQPKAFVALCGRTLLERSLDGLAESEVIDDVVLMVSADMYDAAEALLVDPTNRASWGGMGIHLALGGGERADSVFSGLETMERQLGSSVECVELAQVSEAIALVHDAARCLTPPGMIRRIVAAMREAVTSEKMAGIVPALQMTDTIKVVEDGMITSTPPRSRLRAVQTPQAFLFSSLLDANRKHQANIELGFGHAAQATDDASIMELADYPVGIVPGDDRAMKITTAQDYAIAELMIQRKDNPHV